MQRYFVTNKKNDFFYLEAGDIHHVRNVMRYRVGDLIECVFESEVYVCRIEQIDLGMVGIVSKLFERHESKWNVTIAVSLVKEQKMDFILQKLTELGVDRILPLKMERSIVHLDDERFQKKKERWIKICKEASEQSKRNSIPEIMDCISLKELKHYHFDYSYFCSVSQKNCLISKCLDGNLSCGTMIFVIGPEGGISLLEEELLKSYGYLPVSFGNQVMRVETAAIYVASVIHFCSMRG